MNRRKFIQAFAAAVASVSIGMKLSQGMPELVKIHGIDERGNEQVDTIRFKATERFSNFSHTDWRAVYGSPG